MRNFLIIFVAAVVSILALLHSGDHAGAQTSPPSESPSPRLNLSKIHPKMVALMREQAEGRKEFFDSESKVREEFKKEQNEQMQELLEKHRAARADFSKEKHSADERATFYRGQRDEMAALKTRQKSEKKKHVEELKVKFAEFQAEQIKERRELETELRKSK